MDIKKLLPELKKLVTAISEDLLTRSTLPEIDQGLREAYTQIEKGGRTADAFEVWREDYLDQVAVAWVLSCVFVRFMEDNHLIDECWLAGEGDRRKQAEDSHELYFREHPRESDREYFEHVFQEVGKIPACKELFAEGKTPLWAVGPSGDAAMKLLGFWREVDADDGNLKRTFDVEAEDTRFLGDLYQDLSERARDKFALLQTPVFVEEFILDRTLNPAIDEFGLDEVRMIDPTCGSGHFLLGGFARLFDLWIKREDNEVVAAQKALDGVWGVDVNPFAVAIARFRLIVAALKACEIKRLKKAPAWNIHLATGDSLLFGSRWDSEGQKKGEQQFFATDEESWAPEIYACEDKQAILEVLSQQYHAVVGNPPYITPKDKSLNQAYRDRYSTCHRQYSLAVPFVERFFDLCLNDGNGIVGYLGKITANSFMKREFGKKLIEDYLPKFDVTHIVDTSGAYIPGHGTPTVILFGRNRRPHGDTIRAVLGIKGEPSTPAEPAHGLVWHSIVNHIDLEEVADEYTSTSNVLRSTFNNHPWTIGGGGAGELKTLIESCDSVPLGSVVSEIGRSTHTGEDNVFYLEQSACRTKHLVPFTVPLIEGEGVRDYCINYSLLSLFPYNISTATPIEVSDSAWIQHFWRYRTTLKHRKDFGQYIEERGLRWYDHSMFFPSRYRAPMSISFAFVATHNHFALDRGGKVFKQSAPIIKLQNDATEEDHLGLLGLLNSSVVCFWIRLMASDKGMSGGVIEEQFDRFFMLNGTTIGKIPIPTGRPLRLSQELDRLGQTLSNISPRAILTNSDGRNREKAKEPLHVEISHVRQRLRSAHEKWNTIRGQMIALQEELDWQCYELYGLLNAQVSNPAENECLYSENVVREVGELSLGQRAFEIVMARQIEIGNLQTKWFTRHGSTPITNVPSHWPEAYRRIVERRIQAIESNKEIGLIEKPEYKRRWNTESWEDQQRHVLKDWLLASLETERFWPDTNQQVPRLQSVANLSDKLSTDPDFMEIAAIYKDREDFDLSDLVAKLLESESVPFLPVLRYKPAGLRKSAVWKHTWELQRKVDAGSHVGEIKVPPKYTSTDFQNSRYWRLRGRLDVPKERWISFPHCETEGDPSLVVGWAGWNYLQQGTAIVAYYDARKNEGWSAEKLKPLLAALDQLLPWIHQWHPEIDPEYNETAGTSFQTLLESEAQELGLTLEQIRNWKPPAKTKAIKKTAAKKPRKKKTEAEAEE